MTDEPTTKSHGPDDEDVPPTPAEALEAAWELFTEAPNDNPTLALAQLSTVNVMLNMGNLAAAIERNEIDSRIAVQLELLGRVFVDENSAHNLRERQANRLGVMRTDALRSIARSVQQAPSTPRDSYDWDTKHPNDGRDQYDNEPGVLDFMDQPAQRAAEHFADTERILGKLPENQPTQSIVHPMERLREMFGGDAGNLVISAVVRGYENANPHFAGRRPVTAEAIRAVVENQIVTLDREEGLVRVIPEDRIERLIHNLIFVVTGERV